MSALAVMKTAFCRTIGSASLAAKVPVSCALTIIRPHPSPAAAHASPSIFLIPFTNSLTPASCASRPSRGNAATRSRYGLAGIRNALALGLHGGGGWSWSVPNWVVIGYLSTEG
ncbi:hypothetical protein N9P82_00855 [bacterium]|nr:hypothetical protein [bacterium]